MKNEMKNAIFKPEAISWCREFAKSNADRLSRYEAHSMTDAFLLPSAFGIGWTDELDDALKDIEGFYNFYTVLVSLRSAQIFEKKLCEHEISLLDFLQQVCPTWAYCKADRFTSRHQRLHEKLNQHLGDCIDRFSQG
jgi:hypothetical protein